MPEELSPYIGPRAFKTGELLFGRDDETQRLFDLLLAERIVLLYSPSGAGKTSLIQARIVPKLGEEDFIIARNIRMNAKPPHLDELPLGDNRYLFATKYSIDQNPDLDPWPAEKLAATTLANYLEQRFPAPAAGEPARPIALLFDQFEEVLTLDSMDDDVKYEFFRQLGLTLRNRRIFALFAMREEFIAALDAYSKQLPTRLQTRLRLNLLDRAKAEEAIRLPAERAGVAFNAAKKLALDLSSTRVRRGGKTEEVPGPWVEPVQLQVVCSSLWKKPRQNPKEISDDDLTGVTDVDTALGEYYEESVASIAKEGLATEREVHDWFNDHLITERGIRAQVPRDEPKSGGLDNKAVDRLLDDHLIRPEERRGTVWYELAHDRLVEPIRASNRRWEEKNLKPFQRAASRYGEGKGGLLRDAELVAGKQWVDEHPKEATPVEKAFLAECIAALDPLERGVYEWQLSGRMPDHVLTGKALSDAEASAAKKDSLTELEEALLQISVSQRESEHLQRRWQNQQQQFQYEIQLRERQRRLWERRITAGLLVALVILVPLLFYSFRAANARKDQLELKQLTEKVARTIGPYTLENRTPVSTQDFIHRFDAQNRLSAIAEKATPQQRSQIIVEYSAKAADVNRLSNVLSKLGLQVKGVPAANPDSSNCVWYAAQVPENDVKVVAFALIRAGIILQGIQARHASSPPLTIQIGHNPSIEDLPPLTPDAISNNSLKALQRTEAKARNNVEGIVTKFDPCTHQGTIETTTNESPERVFFEARPEVWPFDEKGVRVTFNKDDRVMFTLFSGPVRHYAHGVKLLVVPKADTNVNNSLRSLLRDCAH